PRGRGVTGGGAAASAPAVTGPGGGAGPSPTDAQAVEGEDEEGPGGDHGDRADHVAGPVPADHQRAEAGGDGPRRAQRGEHRPGPTAREHQRDHRARGEGGVPGGEGVRGDRKSTRLNSSHVSISYAVFCLKKKKKTFSIHK